MKGSSPADWQPGHTIGVVLSGIIAVAAFLPWAKVSAGIFSVTKDGIEGDGLFTLIVGLVIGAAALANIYGRFSCDRLAIAMIIAGGIVAAIGAIDWANLERVADQSESDLIRISPGIGLIVTTFAGIGLIITAALGHQHDR